MFIPVLRPGGWRGQRIEKESMWKKRKRCFHIVWCTSCTIIFLKIPMILDTNLTWHLLGLHAFCECNVGFNSQFDLCKVGVMHLHSVLNLWLSSLKQIKRIEDMDAQLIGIKMWVSACIPQLVGFNFQLKLRKASIVRRKNGDEKQEEMYLSYRKGEWIYGCPSLQQN